MLKPRHAAVGLLLVAQAEWSIGLITMLSGFDEHGRRPLTLVEREMGPAWRLATGRHGRLAVDEESRQPLALRAGIAYRLEAVCDGNCSELALTLFDENGNEVDRDRRQRPSVSVTPVRSATFLLKVSMARCRAAGCGYAAGLFTDAR